MLRTFRIGMWCAALAIAWLQIPVSRAQQASVAAPVPSQIITAKRVFISNATGEVMVAGVASNPTYDEFYAALKSWGRYELVSTPADADLIFEIHFTVGMGPTSIINGSGSLSKVMQFHVIVLDPKTHVLLWEITQPLQGANRVETGRKNFTQAMANLVGSVKKLCGQPVDAADSAKK